MIAANHRHTQINRGRSHDSIRQVGNIAAGDLHHRIRNFSVEGRLDQHMMLIGKSSHEIVERNGREPQLFY